MKVRILSTKYYDNKEMLDKYPLLRRYGFEMISNWYMGLRYRYEDESGIHERYYPKVEFPFFCGKLPQEEFSSDRFGLDELTISLFTNEVAVFRGNFLNPVTGRMMHDVCIIDNLVKPAAPAHEMTIEEIEKKLGYKVKIVNKENNNGS